MHTNTSQAPSLISTVRIVSLITGLFVALASGTNYVFSAYGPQLGARLHLSHTQLNVLSLAGNMGMYGSAPILGKLVDAKGPRILLVIAFVTLLAGYAGVHHYYNEGIPLGATDISFLSFAILVFCELLTGLGGNGGLSSALNATANSWPDRLRASTTGLVISGFGLSAFLFSTIAHIFFAGDTSSFLLVLAIGTSIPMVFGFFFVKQIPPSEANHSVEHGHPTTHYEDDDFSSETPASAFFRNHHDDSQTHLLPPDQPEELDELSSDEEEDGVLSAAVEIHPSHPTEHTDYLVPAPPRSINVALSPTRNSLSGNRHRSRSAFSRRSLSHGAHKALGADGLPNITGKALAVSRNFWLLFVMLSLLAGTGLMYINNVGSVAQALFANGNPNYDEVEAAQFQALQVSIVSIMNCAGRLLIGLIADFTKNYLRLPRSFCITLVSSAFVISQLTLYSVTNIGDLWKASLLLGGAYGGLFGLWPTMVIEWFGLPHFSENWGFVSLSPLIGSNIFSLAFGANLDAHADLESPKSPTTNSSSVDLHTRGGLPSTHHCISGRECYVDTVKLTIAACCLALVLSIYAGWRDYRRSKSQWARRRRAAVLPPAEVIWEDVNE